MHLKKIIRGFSHYFVCPSICPLWTVSSPCSYPQRTCFCIKQVQGCRTMLLKGVTGPRNGVREGKVLLLPKIKILSVQKQKQNQDLMKRTQNNKLRHKGCYKKMRFFVIFNICRQFPRQPWAAIQRCNVASQQKLSLYLYCVYYFQDLLRCNGV